MPSLKPKGLIIGAIDKTRNAYIDESNRKKHTVVLGAKGTGKSETVLPALVRQDFENKKAGVTIVTGNKEVAMLMYSLAKRNGRDVHIIKPTITDSGKNLLSQCRYDYNAIKEDVIDFEQAIRKKEVVIVDMEFALYHEKSIQSVAYLLHALHEAMTRENDVKETPHYLYVDDSHLYFPYVQPILMNGSDYGVGCILFLESRQFLTDIEKAYLDSATRNKLILSGLTISDAKYVSEEIYERHLEYLLNRKRFQLVYMTEANEMRITGVCELKPLESELLSSLRLSVPRHRGNIERNQMQQDKTASLQKNLQSPKELKKEAMKPEFVEKDETKRMGESTELNADTVSDKLVPNAETESMRSAREAKTKVMMPEQRQREKLTKLIKTETKRHVVQIDNLFDEDEEF